MSLVSIVISSYNQSKFIQESINSVLLQNYSNIEIIIIDDASSDNSIEIIKELVSQYRDHKIKLIIKEENEGNVYSRNIGLKESKGKYICFLDGDDYYLPNKISTQVSYFEKHPNQIGNYHDANVFDSDSGKSLYKYSQRYGAGNVSSTELISKGMFIHFGSIMFKKDSIKNIHFDETLRMGDDWLFTVSLLHTNRKTINFLPEIFTMYRRHLFNKTLNWEGKIHHNHLMLDKIEIQFKSVLMAVRRRRADLFFMEIVFNVSHNKYRKTIPKILGYFIYSFPNPLKFLRLLTRELIFLTKNNFKLDYLQKSLISSKKS